jgi:hypothetical protein
MDAKQSSSLFTVQQWLKALLSNEITHNVRRSYEHSDFLSKAHFLSEPIALLLLRF